MPTTVAANWASSPPLDRGGEVDQHVDPLERRGQRRPDREGRPGRPPPRPAIPVRSMRRRRAGPAPGPVAPARAAPTTTWRPRNPLAPVTRTLKTGPPSASGPRPARLTSSICARRHRGLGALSPARGRCPGQQLPEALVRAGAAARASATGCPPTARRTSPRLARARCAAGAAASGPESTRSMVSRVSNRLVDACIRSP